MGASVYHALKSVLKKQGLSTGLGDEGGFAPNLPANVAALELISTAVEATGLKLGTDIALALDVASTEFFDATAVYTFEGRSLSSDEMTDIYTQWIDAFPIVSIEDPLAEDDWAGWSSLVGQDRRQDPGRRRRPVRHQRRPGCSAVSTRRPPAPCWSRSTRSAR